MSRTLKSFVATAGIAGALALGGGAALAAVGRAATPAGKLAGGPVRVWATPGPGAVDKILITGAIGDHGTATSIDKDGKVDANGNYVKVALAAGGFEVNATAFDTAFSKASPHLDAATCSGWYGASGPVTLFDGTGSYAGISGTVTITSSYAAIAPRYASDPKKGQCNLGGNANPVAQFESDIIGTGTVKF